MARDAGCERASRGRALCLRSRNAPAFSAAAIYDPSTSPRVAFPNNTIPASRFDPIAIQVLAHYPLPNAAGANNYVRTAVEPDNQDQFDGRIDHVFNDKHRAFVRYSYLRDNDTPVTFLPDGSGNITSGVIGHAITRGDGIASEYDWTISPSMLNQARFGYTRRDVNQASLQNGGITVPGAPVSTFPSTLPIFTVTGFQQIGPTTAANANFTTSVTEYLDTLSIVRGHHTFKFGTDIRREALDIVNPANPTGSYAFTTTGTNSSTGAGGNALASLLLGQVNAFSIDIQNQAIAGAGAYRGVFLGRRLEGFGPADVEPGHALHAELPFDGSEQPDGDLQSEYSGSRFSAYRARTGVLRLRPARRARLPDWRFVGDSVGVWHWCGSSRPGITTPFTLPQFPFVQTVGQQSQDNINPAFVLSSGPTVQVSAPNPNSAWGKACSGWTATWGPAIRSNGTSRCRRRSAQTLNLEVGYLGSKNTHLGLPESNLNQLPAADLAPGAGAYGNECPILITGRSRLVLAGAADHHAAAVVAALSAIHECGAVSG